jgi:hypothetical protein
MKPIRADEPGWQVACWKLALAKKRFEVDGLSDHHQPFSIHLCSSLGYEIKRGAKKSVFVPLASPAAPAELSRANTDPGPSAPPQDRPKYL